MKRGYKAEYEVKKLLFKKYSPESIFKVAIGGATDFFVLGKNGKIQKFIEVKKTNKKKWYPGKHDLKQFKILEKIQKKYKIPVEYWIKSQGRWQIFTLREVKAFFSKMKKIYTLGTSNRTQEEFLEILDFYQIKTVVDVRHWPTSKLFPHFKKENLEKILKEKGREYYHLENLGGYRKGGYEEYTKTKDFKEGLENLIQLTNKKAAVIICAERFPWKCHRAIIARELEKKSIKVIHIIEKNKIWQPKIEPKEIKPTCQN